jgi:hypothetical protein
MNQANLFKIQLVDEVPSPYGGKDAKALGIDASSNEYLLKRLEDGDLLPLTEWVCHHVCRLVGVPTPEFSVVLRTDGEPAFGSRIDLSAADFNKPPVLTPADQISIVKDAGSTMSTALALDIVLPNPDRHFGNWLYAPRRRKFIALAIDWSRCDAFTAPPFQRWPWPPECNSSKTVELMKQMGALDADSLRHTWRELAKIDSHDLLTIIRSAPELWRAKLDENAMLNWWSNHLTQRLIDSENFILT